MTETINIFALDADEKRINKSFSRPGLHVIREKVADMSEAVKADRNKYIGGSDAGAIFGMNPWKSPYALWCEKTGKISGEVEDNDAMRTGRDLEAYVAERFMEASGKKVQRDNHKYTLKEYPFMVGHIDRRVIGENAILECKTANSFQNAAYEAGEWPEHYYVQCQHYMAVTGADRVYLGVLCFPHFYWTVYNRDEEEIQALLKAESDFWELVQNDTPPEVDGSDSTQEALSKAYPYSNPDSSLRLSEEAQEATESIDRINQSIKALEELKTEKENIIKAFLGEAETGLSDSWKITWKTQESRRIDSTRLKKERPDIYEHYSKTTENRVLRRKRIKENDRSQAD